MPTTLDASAVRMRSLAVELPTQLKEGFQLGRDAEARLPRAAQTAVAVGMGGSAIAADLLRGVTDAETPLVLSVSRGPGLPKAVGRGGLVLLASYSGNTWETLAAYDAARRQGATCVALTSGGTLAELAERDGVPQVLLPPGLPPRAAIGYLLGGYLGVLDGYFLESNEGRVGGIAARLSERQGTYASAKGAPATLAKRLGARTPVFYAEPAFGALARRFATQVEENAKRLAHHDTFPEILHNAIVAWDAMGRPEARRWAVFALEGGGLDAATSTGMAHLGRMLIARGLLADRVVFDAEDRLEAILDGVSFGDHFSLHLAARDRTDPLEIVAIDRLKAAVARR
jgi:glucose/mannose-6-phosphate isomerase